jgi:hypothetical protein
MEMFGGKNRMTKLICNVCEEEFDPNSPEKRKAGGLRFSCPSCSKETTVKYVGLQSGDGKQSQATILKFDSEQDKNNYIDFWKNNSGFNKSKSCQLGKHLSTTPNIKFKTIIAAQNMNHKGKAD